MQSTFLFQIRNLSSSEDQTILLNLLGNLLSSGKAGEQIILIFSESALALMNHAEFIEKFHKILQIQPEKLTEIQLVLPQAQVRSILGESILESSVFADMLGTFPSIQEILKIIPMKDSNDIISSLLQLESTRNLVFN